MSTRVRSCSLPTALGGSQVPQGRNPSPPYNTPPLCLSTSPHSFYSSHTDSLLILDHAPTAGPLHQLFSLLRTFFP